MSRGILPYRCLTFGARWRIDFARLFGLVAVLILVVASCGNNEPTSTTAAEPGIDGRALHVLQQETIATCMRRAGHDYQMTAYQPQRDVTEATALLEIYDADLQGYGFVRSVFTTYAPVGQPGSQTSLSATQAYDTALFGSDEWETTADAGGCFAEGRQARRAAMDNAGMAQSIWDEPELAAEVLDRLLASSEYGKFTDTWSTCMVQAGQEPQGDVMQHRNIQFTEMLPRILASFQQAHESESDSDVLHRMATVTEITDDQFEEVLAAHSPIALLHAEEVTLATPDSACRSEAMPIVEPVLASLLDDVRDR